MNKAEYIEDCVARTGLPRAVVEQGVDMAKQAMSNALREMIRTVELHDNERVRVYASYEILVMLHAHVSEKMPLAARMLQLLMAEARANAN